MKERRRVDNGQAEKCGGVREGIRREGRGKVDGGKCMKEGSQANGKGSIRQVQVHAKTKVKDEPKKLTSSRSIYATAAPSYPVDVPVREELCAPEMEEGRRAHEGAGFCDA